MSNCKRQSRAESFRQIKSRRKEQHSKLAVNKLNRANLLDFLVPLLARENRYLPSSGWKVQQQTKLIQASPVFFGVPKQRPETACSFVASPMTGYKDKKRSLIGQVSTDEFGANWFLKMKPRLRLAYFMKGMLFGCEQPFLWWERCVTSQKTAAEETRFYSTSPELTKASFLTRGSSLVLSNNSDKNSAVSINLLAFYHECRSLIGYATHVLFCDR